MTKLPMPFDDPSTYEGHTGVDFGEPSGKEILASGPGTVNYAGYVNEKAGYGVAISYDAYPGVEFLYAHQLKNGIRPKAGSRFVFGGYLGPVGNTGHSKGPHLHLEVSIGKGAHTYDGVWLYFDENNWVGKSDPKPSNEKDDDEMKIFSVTDNGGYFFATSRGLVKVRNPDELEILRRFIDYDTGKEPEFNDGQRDIINYYLTAPVLSWNDLNPS